MGREAGAVVAGVPDPADIRLRLARVHGLRVPCGEAVTMPAATAAARALRTALRPDVAVFASAGGAGPVLTVLQLVSDSDHDGARGPRRGSPVKALMWITASSRPTKTTWRVICGRSDASTCRSWTGLSP